MNDYQDDEALARLRAADPATGAHPDLHRISQRLRGRTPLGSGPVGGFAPGTGYSFSDTSDTAVRVSDPGARTSRVGFVVAASVAALAFGGGGYVMGVASGDDDQGGPTTTAADSDDEREASDGSDSVEDLAASEGEAYGGDGDIGYDSAAGGYAGPVVPVAGDGLSTERTTGTVYAADQGGEAADPGALLEQYAGALGIEGTTESDSQTAYVTDATDGRSVHVYAHGGLVSVDYSNPALDPYCEDYMAEPGMMFGEDGPDTITCVPPGDAPDEETAIALVKEFADTAGFSYDDYEFRFEVFDPMIAYGEDYEELMGEQGEAPPADDTVDTSASTAAPDAQDLLERAIEEWGPEGYPDVLDVSVTAHRTDAPLKNYQSWYFGVTDQGVSYASFQLGEYVSLGDYPVISPAEAVERANDIRFQQIGAYIPDLEFDASYFEEWTEPEPLPPLTAGEPIPYPLTESTVTGAELHSGVVNLWDGTEFIAPVYHLTDDEGNSWQVLGLAEDALDFTP